MENINYKRTLKNKLIFFIYFLFEIILKNIIFLCCLFFF